ncbi:hypothetical protein B0H11DRAFT_824659 [Mycena galericulata]|nr:hypothetical protein B0H11DRAFT_824659 [Mycena galericulata]
MATTMRRPAELAPSPSRAAQRKQRLLELENEQRLEDAEALKMTEEQRLSLFHSFRTVKFEWSDLDGMHCVRRRYNPAPLQCQSPPRSAHVHPVAAPHAVYAPGTQPRPPHLQLPASTPASAPVPIPHPSPSPSGTAPPSMSSAFAVLTNARLASFGADDTICVRSTSTSTSFLASSSFEMEMEMELFPDPPTPMPDTPMPMPMDCAAPQTPTPHSYARPPTPTPYSESHPAFPPSPPGLTTKTVVRSTKVKTRVSPSPGRGISKTGGIGKIGGMGTGKARSPVKGLFPSPSATSPSATSSSSSAAPATPPGLAHPHPGMEMPTTTTTRAESMVGKTARTSSRRPWRGVRRVFLMCARYRRRWLGVESAWAWAWAGSASGDPLFAFASVIPSFRLDLVLLPLSTLRYEPSTAVQLQPRLTPADLLRRTAFAPHPTRTRTRTPPRAQAPKIPPSLRASESDNDPYDFPPFPSPPFSLPFILFPLPSIPFPLPFTRSLFSPSLV